MSFIEIIAIIILCGVIFYIIAGQKVKQLYTDTRKICKKIKTKEKESETTESKNMAYSSFASTPFVFRTIKKIKNT